MLKRCLVTCSVLLNVAFIFYACTKQQVQPAAGEPPAAAAGQQLTTEGAAGTATTTTCYGPFYGMPYTDVNRMIQNYNNKQYVAIKNTLGFRDAKNCWFDIYKIKNFICKAESILQQSGCPLRISGVRFHYAAHDQQSVTAYNLPANYVKLHTLIMVPTYYDAVRQEHYDFNPFLINNNNCTPVPLTREAGGMLANLTMNTGFIFAEDTGQLGPPDEDGLGKTGGR